MTTTDRVAGLNGSVGFKAPCRAATTAAITLSGEQTIDGVAIVSGDRVLVKNQSSGVDNGIYIASTGAWSRALDFNGVRDARNGTLVYVTNGTLGGDKIYITSGADPITVGFTSLSFSVLDLSDAVYTLTAGAGLTGGGTLDQDRSVALAAIADDRVMANISGSSAAPSAATLSDVIDACIGSTRGQILYRGASAWQALAAGTAGHVLTSNGAGADPSWQATGAAVSIPTGAVEAFAMSAAPAGWLKCNGQTIGNAASGGTAWANAGASALFTILWDNFANAQLPIQDSTGAASTRGANAAADFAANKRMPLPDLRGEWVRGWADNRAVDTSRVFGSTQAEMIGPHNHGITDSGHTHQTVGGPNAAGSGTVGAAGQNANAYAFTSTTSTTGISVNNNTGTENRVRNVALLYCIKT